ncbi:hypothetical protein [Moorena sp. SIO4A5]|uniref:hypothetical protein n=1 Tax=Moorena sp. SIO4A5 TaxID=2607838 RepID=UPI0025FA33E4|nr:hypothetical protein [Moorena sp. SIO4A5]
MNVNRLNVNRLKTSFEPSTIPASQLQTIQPFNHSTIQPFNPSTLQPFNLQPFNLQPWPKATLREQTFKARSEK